MNMNEAFLLQNSRCLFSRLPVKLLIHLQVQKTALHRDAVYLTTYEKVLEEMWQKPQTK